eukprot:scaffold21854_cov68-Phaeocystis_antarctica.AAC.2
MMVGQGGGGTPLFAAWLGQDWIRARSANSSHAGECCTCDWAANKGRPLVGRDLGAVLVGGGRVPASRFELETFCMLSRRDNQLHHAGLVVTARRPVKTGKT